MYIKSVVIDGFKSYGRRTEVNGFDPEFNAITGLNGTGKSNILDSICFVLGISNLSQVRAQSLQDLVYNSGQAGVTKATVTINFDNSNKSQCPIGYENCHEIAVARQIVVGGKGKYLINGKNAQYEKIQDLFCSVQLNINNPDFLIMQGRITKVLNMKPPEILSMIEEAAGISMYENKKEKSMTIIQKIDNRLEELNQLIPEELKLKLEKLQQQQQQYLKYQNICREIEYFTRIHISYKYVKCLESVENSEGLIEKLDVEIEKYKKIIIFDFLFDSIKNQTVRYLKELEKELDELNQRDAKIKAANHSLQEEIASDQRKLKALQNNIKIDEAALAKKEEEMNKSGDVYEKLKEEEANDLKAFNDAQKKLEAINLGLALNDEGEATTLQDQLSSKSRNSEGHRDREIKSAEAEMKRTEEKYKKSSAN
ncbi:CLUMA_CG009645, isoform A [Clunio marinus]|uniref:CLUMA_CG009645, isoform A n=1 Tax=Clunio marinus TaxID=568069 RepID=A0A1J1I915_9DIPT|nr:CLUMA_CG009645, isoform A [Clunio marinus]